jgi:putative tricarboxylic transport membrane protein
MQQVLQQTGIVRTVLVENVPGAAGTIGLARFVGSARGRGDALMVSGLIMMGGVVMHGSVVTLRDVTPIARITGEYEVIVVPANSPLRTFGDLIQALRDRPEAISWGGGSAGGSDQILAGLVARAAGVAPRRINYIAFSGGGESLSAILGAQVSVGVNGLAELEAQIAAGTVRALAVSSAERLPGLDVPTLREQGVDVEFENWRSVVAPPGISAVDRRRLESAVASMVRAPEWRAALARYRWLDRYLEADDFARFDESEEARVRAILVELGTARSGTTLSSGVFPVFVLAGLAICGLLLAVRRRPSSEAAVPGRPTRLALRRDAWWIVIALALTLAMMESAGFVVTAALLFWLTARAFDRRHPLRDAIAAVGVSGAAYLLFARVLQLPLP